MEPEQPKKFPLTPVLAGGLGVVIILGGVTYFVVNKSKTSNQPTDTTVVQTTPTPIASPTTEPAAQTTPATAKASWKATTDTIIVSKGEQAYTYADKSLKPLTPEGYKVISYGSYRQPTPFILLQKDNALFVYDIPSNQTKPLNITLTNAGNIEENGSFDFVGSNRDEALLKVDTYDKTSEEYKNYSDFGGHNPKPIKTQGYRYTFSTGQLVKSNLFETAKTLMEKAGEKFGEFSGPSINYWDNEKNVMYGNWAGEGVGNAAPIFKIDLNAKTVTKSTHNIEKETVNPYFSPSLDKFILVVRGENKTTAQVYSTANINNPVQTYDISSLGDLHSINWSEDRKTAIVTAEEKFYLLETETGKSRLVYTDETLQSSYTAFNPNSPAIILPSGKAFVYIDWTNTRQEDESSLFKKENDRYNLTSVDIATGKATVLLGGAEFIDTVGIAITK